VGKGYKLTGLLERQGEKPDGSSLEYLMRDDGTEYWGFIEVKSSKYSGQATIEVDYDDNKPVSVSLLRDNSVVKMDYLSLCDLVSLVVGIDLMKKKHDKTSIRQLVKVTNIKIETKEVVNILDKISTLSADKIAKISAIISEG
jgi:hypothetical protein